MHQVFLARISQIAVLLLTFLANPVAAVDPADILRPEVAFQYQATDEGDALRVDWTIEPGYYLYKKKLSFSIAADGVQLAAYVLPDGLDHYDEFFGEQQVYRERFSVTLPYTSVGARPKSVELTVKSQGCADLGICFPPQTWTRTVALMSAAVEGDKSIVGQLLADGQREVLPVDEAFRPYVFVIDGNTLEVSWQITPGYYLYKAKLAVSTASDKIQLGKLALPSGVMKYDEFFGESEVYTENVFARLPFARATPEEISFKLQLDFQGCAEVGVCYPPTTRMLSVDLPAASAAGNLGEPVTEQGRLTRLIAEGSLALVLATFFGAGLLLAFTPCVLPMVPILSGIIAGEGRDVSAYRGFTLSLSYVLGMALVYTVAGIAFAAAGQQAQAVFQQPWIIITFAGLFVVLALSMFGLFELQMPSAIQSRLAAISGRQKSGTMIGAFVMGALSSLIVTACVAPPLVATLTVISQTGDIVRGGLALFAMSLGMGMPLLVVGTSAGKLLPKAGSWMEATKTAFGFMMLGLTVWMLSRILPGQITLGLWGVLVFMAGIFMGALTSLGPAAGKMRLAGKGLGLLALLYGAILLVGAFLGGHDPFRPLDNLRLAGSEQAADHQGLKFTRIKTVDDLDNALAEAAAQSRTAMLDFYADWCVSCKEMEAYTFTEAAVQAALAATVLLQADVTANDDEDQALLQRFGVFGPPTIIFFDEKGQQREGYEVVGYMRSDDFVAHVEKALQPDTNTSSQ
ncbi:MAG TPA: protein-disulfide reductase DsbD [Woeseiaceae bacterium]